MSSSSGARGDRREQVAAIVGVLLMPLLIAGTFLWATADSSSRLHEQQAAIVNLDAGARVGDDTVRLGQTYALQLRNQSGPNFTWRYGVSVAEAQSGLASGRYAAAVVIPAGFSRVLTGAGQQDDSATLLVERSPVTGVSDQIVLNTLSEAATQGLAKGVATQYLDNIFVATTELGVGLAETSAQVQELAGGVGQVAEDADTAAGQSQQLTRQAGAAASQASDVQGAAAANAAAQQETTAAQAKSAVSGAGVQSGATAQQEAIGAVEAAAGELAGAADKASESGTGVAADARTAAAQGDKVATNADAVAKAAAANKAAAQAYRGSIKDTLTQQADLQASLGGAQELLSAYADSVGVVAGAVASATSVQDEQAKTMAPGTMLRESATQLTEAADTIEAAAIPADVASAAASAESNASALSDSYAALLEELPADEIKLNDGLGNGCPDGYKTTEACRVYKEGYEAGYNDAVTQVAAALAGSGFGDQISSLKADTAAVSSGIKRLTDSQATSAATLRTLATQLNALADQQDQLSDRGIAAITALSSPEVTEVIDGLGGQATTTDQALGALGKQISASTASLAAVEAEDGPGATLTASATTMTTVATSQTAVVNALTGQLAAMNRQLTTLSSALSSVDTGAAELAQSTSRTDSGATQLAQQVSDLSEQLTALQAAATTASSQATATQTKAQALQRQVSALQQAGSSVTTSVQSVSRNANTQSRRANEVVTAVAENRALIPSADTSDERQRLTDVISAPISTQESNSNRNLTWTPMLMVIALWCGSVAYHAVRPAVSARAKRSADGSALLLAKEMVPTSVVALAQALLLAVVGQVVMRLTVDHALAMAGVMMLAGLVSIVVNHVLRAYLGAVGMSVAIGLATVTLVSVVTGAFPTTLDTVRKLSPTTPMVDALRAAMTGAPGLSHNLWMLAGWLAGGLLFSALAVLRARSGPERRVPTVVDGG